MMMVEILVARATVEQGFVLVDATDSESDCSSAASNSSGQTDDGYASEMPPD